MAFFCSALVIQFILAAVGLTQFLTVLYGSNRIRENISWMTITSFCQATLSTIHSEMRQIPSSNNSEYLNQLIAEISAEIVSLSSNSSSLFMATVPWGKSGIIWGSPSTSLTLMLDMSKKEAYNSTLMDATNNYIRHAKAALKPRIIPANNTDAEVRKYFL
jgi:hypothetical protein